MRQIGKALDLWPRPFLARLLVEDGTQDRNHIVGEECCALVQLKPAHYAMVRQILSNASFGDAEMLRELRLERRIPAPSASAARQVSNGDAQCVASLDIVVAGQIFIREHKHTR